MSDAPQRILVIGNSDGIGKAVTQRLLARGDAVTGVSRSELAAEGDYAHEVCSVTDSQYGDRLRALWDDADGRFVWSRTMGHFVPVPR